jgi:NitT/TauT family transport system substrate-binding protein
MTTPSSLTRRSALTGAAGVATAASFGRRARAAAPTKITFLTSWFAEAEHGGFYQAKATGLYEQNGLDVTIKMGGPQVNGMQLLTGGAADIIIGYDIQLLSSIEKNIPVTAIAAAFQFDLQGIMTHTDIKSLADLKGKKILISAASHTTFWPWLKKKYGYTDAMAGVDTFNLQPFLLDKTVSMQGYPSSEPYEAMKQGEKVNFFLFADEGYPPYSNTLIANNSFIEQNPAAVAAFVKCSMLGWVDYFKNPAPANKLIQADNPKEPAEQIAFAIEKMKEMHVLDRGEAKTKGVGTMSDARWKATHDFLVTANLLKPTVDYKKAFTTKFTDGLKIFA